MKKMIVLPDKEAVQNFVNAVSCYEGSVLVTKVGYTYEVDGSSFLGMMSLMGCRILVEYGSTSEEIRGIIDRYTIAC